MALSLLLLYFYYSLEYFPLIKLNIGINKIDNEDVSNINYKYIINISDKDTYIGKG